METCKTTLECLIGAALSTDANTLGNNSGASYTNRFVFYDKYSFEAYCLDDNNIFIQLCKAKSKKQSEVLVSHCLTINHNELLAPIYAYYLWVDFLSLVNRHALDIDISDFEHNLLNFKEDDMSDRARYTVERVFATADEYEKREDGTHFFMSKEYGPVYFNEDCLEYYIDALHAASDEIYKKVQKSLGNVELLKEIKFLSNIFGILPSDIKEAAKDAKCKLLDKVISALDPNGFAWAINAYNAIENKIYAVKSKPINKSSAEFYNSCIKYFKNGNVNYEEADGMSMFATDLYNWQAQHRVSFDMQTLACIFDDLGFNNLGSADELLRNNDTCELIAQAYLAPSKFK